AVLAFGLGLGYLFFSLYQAYATEALNLLFGNIFGVSDTQLRNLAIVGTVVLLGLALLYRPLLFSSVDPEIAAARGVPLRTISFGCYVAARYYDWSRSRQSRPTTLLRAQALE